MPPTYTRALISRLSCTPEQIANVEHVAVRISKPVDECGVRQPIAISLGAARS